MGSIDEMLLKVLLLVFSLILSAKAVNRGSIQVEGYGEVWVISPDWANGQGDGNGFTLFGNSRMYFASYATDGFDGNAYWQIPLNNKVFSYSVDVIVMLQLTSLTCQETMRVVVVIGTVMLILVTTFGVQNMTHLKQTNILWLEPFIHVMEATITGAGARSTPTTGTSWSTDKTVKSPLYGWSRMEMNLSLRYVMMQDTDRGWHSPTITWFGQGPCGEVMALT